MNRCASLIFFLASSVSIAANAAQSYGVSLSGSRLIYNENDKNGVSITISNPQDFPILVQSRAYAENTETAAPFTVTPPLLRLDEKKSTMLRVLHTGNALASDRETLNWLCVRAVPPEEIESDEDNNGKAKTGLQISINNCIKLFYRPAKLQGLDAEAMAKDVTWKRQGNKLQVTNPTPFFINFHSVELGGVSVEKLSRVAPFSTETAEQPKSASNKISWKIINDYGGESVAINTELN